MRTGKTFILWCVMGATTTLVLLLLVVSCCYNFTICDNPAKNIASTTVHEQKITPWMKYAQELAHELGKRAIIMSQSRNHTPIKQRDQQEGKQNLKNQIINLISEAEQAVNPNITLDVPIESSTDNYPDRKETVYLKRGSRVVAILPEKMSPVGTDNIQENPNLETQSLSGERNQILEFRSMTTINNEPPNLLFVKHRNSPGNGREEETNLPETSDIKNIYEEPIKTFKSADDNIVVKKKDKEITNLTAESLKEFDEVVVNCVTPNNDHDVKLSSQENLIKYNPEQKKVQNESENQQNSTESKENVGEYFKPQYKETTQKDIFPTVDKIKSSAPKINIAKQNNTHEDYRITEISKERLSHTQNQDKLEKLTSSSVAVVKFGLKNVARGMNTVIVYDTNNESKRIENSQISKILDKSILKAKLHENETQLNSSKVEPVTSRSKEIPHTSQNIEALNYSTFTQVDKHRENNKNNNKHDEHYETEKMSIPLQTEESKTVTSKYKSNTVDPLTEREEQNQLKTAVSERKIKTSKSTEMLLAPIIEFATTTEHIFNTGLNERTGMFKIYETLPIPGEPEDKYILPAGSDQINSIFPQQVLPNKQLEDKNEIINITRRISSGQTAGQKIIVRLKEEGEDKLSVNKSLPDEKSVIKSKFYQPLEITTSKILTEISLDIERNNSKQSQNFKPAGIKRNLNSKLQKTPMEQQISSWPSREKIHSLNTSIILPINATQNTKIPEITTKKVVNNDQTKITNAYIIAKYESLPPPMSHDEITEYSEYLDEMNSGEESMYDDPDSKLALCADVMIENLVCQQSLNKTRRLCEHTKTELSQAKERISELETEMKKLGSVTGITEALQMKDMECMAKIAQLKLEFKQYMEVKNEHIDELQNRLNILMNRKGKGETLRSRAIRERTEENIKNMEVLPEN